MTLTLYDVTVKSFLQIIGGVAGFLDRGLSHFTDNDIDPNEMLETRLFPDMLPLRFQIQSVAHHSLGAIEAARTGVFNPPAAIEPLDYAGMQGLIADARAGLQALSPAEVNALAGRDVEFQGRSFKMAFTAEDFLLSLSMPNFHFHAATAYDILRSKGVPLGKRDYLGQVRRKA